MHDFAVFSSILTFNDQFPNVPGLATSFHFPTCSGSKSPVKIGTFYDHIINNVKAMQKPNAVAPTKNITHFLILA